MPHTLIIFRFEDMSLPPCYYTGHNGFIDAPALLRFFAFADAAIADIYYAIIFSFFITLDDAAAADADAITIFSSSSSAFAVGAMPFDAFSSTLPCRACCHSCLLRRYYFYYAYCRFDIAADAVLITRHTAMPPCCRHYAVIFAAPPFTPAMMPPPGHAMIRYAAA